MYTRKKKTPSTCTKTSQAEDTMRLMPRTAGDVAFVLRGTLPKSLVDLTDPARGSDPPFESYTRHTLFGLGIGHPFTDRTLIAD